MTIIPETDVLLGARYRLVSRIAAGGMGEVWSATDEVLGRNVAVKVLRREYADDPEFLQRFRAEARHTAALSHPGIAAVHDYFDGSPAEGGEGQSPFIVMENVPGEPLSSLIAREGGLSHDRTLDVIGQAALALQAAHDAGVIHRDVKPGNILLRPDGVVKITDFGISRATNSVPLTATGAVMGTAFYLSPEQALGQPATPASDVYALGVVAYECLTGRRPFVGETPAGVALAQVRDAPPGMGDGVRAEVAALVLRMLAKEPAARPSSAGELAHDALDMRPALYPVIAVTRTLPATSVDATEVIATGVIATAPGRTAHWVPYAVGLVVCALVVLFVIHSCADDGTASDTSTSGPTSASSSAPVTVLVLAGAYVGEPVADAEAALRALDLRVLSRTVPAGPGVPIGTVTRVTPTGELSPGETVTIEVAAGSDAKPGKHDKKPKGPTPPGHDKKDERKQDQP